MQRVFAQPVKDHRAFHVQCDFVEGSDAQGCMILLVGTYSNVTVNITKRYRNSISADTTVNVVEPTSCYHEVYAFDIEYDGSMGTLAIPGQLSTEGESSLVPQCGIDSSSE